VSDVAEVNNRACNLDCQLDPDAAAKEAKTAGLRNPKYLEKAQAYVERQKEAGNQDQTLPRKLEQQVQP